MGVLGKVIVVSDSNRTIAFIEYEISNAVAATNQWPADKQAMVVDEEQKVIIGNLWRNEVDEGQSVPRQERESRSSRQLG